MRKTFALTAAFIIALPAFAFAQSGEDRSGARSNDSSYSGRSTAPDALSNGGPDSEIGAHTSVRDSKNGYDSDDAH